jgi:hypothetical protein
MCKRTGREWLKNQSQYILNYFILKDGKEWALGCAFPLPIPLLCWSSSHSKIDLGWLDWQMDNGNGNDAMNGEDYE